MRGKILAVAEELLERKQNWQVGGGWFRHKKPLCHLRVLSILRNILGGYSCSAGCAAQSPCRPAYVIAKPLWIIHKGICASPCPNQSISSLTFFVKIRKN